MYRKLLTACIILLLQCTCVFSQTLTIDSNNVDHIEVTHADTAYGTQIGEAYSNRLIGNVVIVHNDVTLTCDSATLFMERKFVEAFGNVTITKSNGGSSKADYIRYTGNNNNAFMKGNVQIIDQNNTLYTDVLIYNLKTKIANYSNGGTLQADETTVNSERGVYNGFTKQCHFIKDVIISNPKYTITSNELTYNTNSKIVQFLDWSEIITENGVINTRKGTYNSNTEKAIFTGRTRVENETQTIEANSLDFNNKEGIGSGKGNVVIIDTSKKTILFCDDIHYNKKTGYSIATKKVKFIDTTNKLELRCNKLEYNSNASFILATEKPILLTKLDNDSLFIKADTLIAFPERLKKELYYTKRKNIVAYNLLYADSSYKKTDEGQEDKRIIVCNRKVKIYSDSTQAVCDSLSYNEVDSTFYLYKEPIVWNKEQQATGDTIIIQTVHSTIHKTIQKNNCFIINDQHKKTIYDQIAGSYIESFFKDGNIDKVYVNKNAESLYYAKDDKGEFIGLNKAEGASITFYFENKEICKIKILDNPKGNFLPMNELTEAAKFLSGFVLQYAKRPMSKYDILQ